MSTAIAKNFQVGADSTATNNFTIRQPATPDGTVRIANGNSGTTTDLVTVTSAGNVGVGTTAPAFKFDLQGGRTVLSANGEPYALGLRYNASTIGTWIGSPSANAFAVYSFGGGEYMRIDANGQMGIGYVPNASQGNLQVWKNITGGVPATSGATDVNQVAVFGGGAVGFSVGLYPSGAVWLQPRAFGNFAVNYNTILNPNGGNLGVGTSAPNARITAQRLSTEDAPTLEIIGPAASSSRVVNVLSNKSGDLSQAALLLSKYDNNSTTSQVFVHFAINNNSTASGQINANGAAQAAFGSWSDARLKENIVDLPPQLGNICSLRPVEFDYKDGSGHQIGFIAQEVQDVYPDVVGEGENGMLMLSGMSKMEARLIKAIQEQQAIIEQLKARIEVLEQK